MLTRRHLGQFLAAPALLPAPSLLGADDGKWTAEWDAAILSAAVARLDAAFDPREDMLRRQVGSEYRYHTNMRSREVHPTRDTLEYALLLLEAGGADRAARAARIVERILSLQETDPSSNWYGLWGYYVEEPAPKMSPADWNWADFNGSLLLLIEYRHGSRLSPALRRNVREGIRHAARSVQRRNVSMTYTNIAVQGSFVTLAAAQLLDDAELRRYAAERLRRFAAAIDLTGSFAEYNSPTYANVTIVNLTRMRMTLRDSEDLELVDRIHTRAWLHLGKHWHTPTRQLAGPHSRSYSTDIGAPLWIQKALGGRVAFASLGDLKARRIEPSAETAIHDYRCPESVAPLFLQAGPPRQHREIFLPASAPVRPVQGTTWLAPDLCLGSVNRGDFWIQRRSLLAYWGGNRRPARFVQARFLKDDYDFTSALLYTVQQDNCILGLVNFRSPGGDKHPNLDPIENGEFEASRLRFCLDIAGAPKGAKILTGDSHLAVDLGGAKLWLNVREAAFRRQKPALSVEHEGDRLMLSIDLLRANAPQRVRWSETPAAYAVFSLAMEGASGSLEQFQRKCQAMSYEGSLSKGRVSWRTPAGWIGLTGNQSVKPVAEQDRAFSEWLDGKPVPLVRLSDERLA